MERLAAYLTPRLDLGAAVDLARLAESRGYECLWVTHGTSWDSLMLISAYAHATRTIGLGSGVLPIYLRHPVALAQEALTLTEVCGGRFRLGIGIGHRTIITDALGLDMGNPIQVMREYVAILRSALSGQAEEVGTRYRVRWKSAFPRLPRPPSVFMAGLSARMLELAGEIADGVILWLCCPAYVREIALPAAARGRAKLGKSLDGFEVVAAVPVAFTDDPEVAFALFKQDLMRYLGLPFYRAMLAASGFREDIAAFDRNGVVSDRLAASLGVVGDQKTLRDYVTAYRQAGVTLPAVRPIGLPDADHYRSTLEACAPRGG